jgi:Rieske Fe-S protein
VVGRCEMCGNDYDKSFEITMSGDTQPHVFDSFECAIHAVAPVCGHCGCRIIGHGVEADGSIFCCAHCSRESGIEGLKDRQT